MIFRQKSGPMSKTWTKASHRTGLSRVVPSARINRSKYLFGQLHCSVATTTTNPPDTQPATPTLGRVPYFFRFSARGQSASAPVQELLCSLSARQLLTHISPDLLGSVWENISENKDAIFLELAAGSCILHDITDPATTPASWVPVLAPIPVSGGAECVACCVTA